MGGGPAGQRGGLLVRARLAQAVQLVGHARPGCRGRRGRRDRGPAARRPARRAPCRMCCPAGGPRSPGSSRAAWTAGSRASSAAACSCAPASRRLSSSLATRARVVEGGVGGGIPGQQRGARLRRPQVDRAGGPRSLGSSRAAWAAAQCTGLGPRTGRPGSRRGSRRRGCYRMRRRSCAAGQRPGTGRGRRRRRRARPGRRARRGRRRRTRTLPGGSGRRGAPGRAGLGSPRAGTAAPRRQPCCRAGRRGCGRRGVAGRGRMRVSGPRAPLHGTAA